MAPAGKKERRRSRITLDQDHFKSTRPAAPGRKEEDKREKEGKVDEVNRALPLWQLSCLPERRKEEVCWLFTHGMRRPPRRGRSYGEMKDGVDRVLPLWQFSGL